jgi:transposase
MLIAERTQNERLRQIIKELQRHRFGRRAETLPEDQMLLGLEDVEQLAASNEAKTEAANPAERASRSARRRTNRGSLPAHLPRIEVVVDIEDHACPCCGNALHRIGEDMGERLDMVPAQFRVLVVRRPKYACRSCENVVVQAPAPGRLIEGGLPTEATVAQVLVSKYADHLPLYRQAQIYARQGINLDRSTLADWVGRAAFMLRPVHERLMAALKASPKLFADETTAPVLDPGRGRTKIGQLWAYARDDRPWGGTDPPGVAYVYAPDRKAKQPIPHLAGFAGILQVDGYGGYRALAERNDVLLAFCWSHVRRPFYELAAAGPAPIASEALERIAGLYAIEKEIRGLGAEERRAVRQDKSRPILDDLEPWLRAKLALISQKTKLAKAIRYALTRWNGLTRFLGDGRIEIDSNIVERSIRPISLNRKNALFAGSDGGGEHWAVIASVIETALCRARHKAVWTKPLRGRAVWQPSVPPVSTCLFERLRLRHHEGLLAAAFPCRKGASHDCSPTTNDRGYAGAESVASHAGVVSPTGLAIRTPLRSVAGCADSRAHSHLSNLSDQREEAGYQFNTCRRRGASIPLQGHTQAGMGIRGRDSPSKEAAETARRSESGGSRTLPRLRCLQEAPRNPDHLLRRRLACIGSCSAECRRYR